MRDEHQGGSDYNLRDYYKKVVRMLPDRDCKFLNIGSGNVFAFEKYVRDARGGYRDELDCLDIMECSEVPDIVDKYYCADITKSIEKGKYDCVFSFEVIEHIDQTDELVLNAYGNLRGGGLFFLTHPNLSSLQSRLELLLGFQPHILEMSNRDAWLGGVFLHGRTIRKTERSTIYAV